MSNFQTVPGVASIRWIQPAKPTFPPPRSPVRRALALGLDKETPLLARTMKYMQKILEGRTAWADRVEKSEGWPIAVEAITAATLAQVNPAHPAVLPAWEYWVGIALRSFPKGDYDPSAELDAR